MKTAFLLSLALFAAAPAGAVTTLTFEQRVALAREAEDDERFDRYPDAMAGKAGRHIAQSMRQCRAFNPRNAVPFVLVADIGADGVPRDVEVNPRHAASKCFAARFSASSYLPPPAYPGRNSFPVMLRVDPGS
ncbi:MAG TPA: hypothetical protein VEC01_03570 [Noviherbaspirillum sp.]|uniref:hypothetical protein n=1 Tax=Noviherbaspirillum sp. TaxID=1926288 RepID=UPI002D5AB82C|nr:hypothetical protein [Noviherbaspirillum sp.]HYD94381.1 hypothetical protein [Noviherbaspirillum sp.]